MTSICPHCMQSLPFEKENEKKATLKQLLEDEGLGKVIGLWGDIGYVSSDDLDKRYHVKIHAAHVGAFLNLLALHKSFENIKIYDKLGTNNSSTQTMKTEMEE